MTPPTRACDTIAPLLPWHVNGTLAADERAAVTGHLTGCAACRALATPAAAFRALAARVPPGRLLEHVQAQLLVEFVEAPEVLADEPRAWVAAHLATCDVCGGAAGILRDMRALPDAILAEGSTPGRVAVDRTAAMAARVRTDGPPPFFPRLWDRLSMSVLRPLPALVYLVVALLALPGLRQTFAPTPSHQAPPAGADSDAGVNPGPGADGRPVQGPGSTATAPPVVLAPPQQISAGLEMRGGGQADPAPVPIRVTPGRPLLLEIDPDLDREDLLNGTAAFAIELRIDDAPILTLPCGPDDFDARGRLRLVVPADLVSPGAAGTLVLRLRRPGQARDGEVLFRRGLEFAGPPGSGPR